MRGVSRQCGFSRELLRVASGRNTASVTMDVLMNVASNLSQTQTNLAAILAWEGLFACMCSLVQYQSTLLGETLRVSNRSNTTLSRTGCSKRNLFAVLACVGLLASVGSLVCCETALLCEVLRLCQYGAYAGVVVDNTPPPPENNSNKPFRKRSM